MNSSLHDRIQCNLYPFLVNSYPSKDKKIKLIKKLINKDLLVSDEK